MVVYGVHLYGIIQKRLEKRECKGSEVGETSDLLIDWFSIRFHLYEPVVQGGGLDSMYVFVCVCVCVCVCVRVCVRVCARLFAG